MKTYRVKDWDKHYETAETRKLVSLRWLPVPNKHDGLGYRRIAAQPNAAELFTAWILILQVASKGRGPDERGNLLRGQEALGAEDLAMMTGFPVAIFERALDFFSNPKQGWLLVHEDELTLSAGTPADSPVIPASSPAVWNGMEGMERKGEKEVADAPTSASNEKANRIPTIAEWVAHCHDLSPQWPRADVEAAWHHYDSIGWKKGKNLVVRWKGCAATCHNNWKAGSFGQRSFGQPVQNYPMPKLAN